MSSKDDLIAELRLTIEQQVKTIERLEKRLQELELELARAKKDSSNSSKSPSSDIVKPPEKQKRVATNRKKAKRGGQKGHQRKLREPLPPERVDSSNKPSPSNRTLAAMNRA